jgi:hypothetical protein
MVLGIKWCEMLCWCQAVQTKANDVLLHILRHLRGISSQALLTRRCTAPQLHGNRTTAELYHPIDRCGLCVEVVSTLEIWSKDRYPIVPAESLVLKKPRYPVDL